MQTGMLAMPDLLGAGFGELEVTVHRQTERGPLHQPHWKGYLGSSPVAPKKYHFKLSLGP